MKIFKRLYIAIALLFLYLPIAVMILFSFNSGSTRSIFRGFSFKWYVAMFTNSDLLKVLGNTLVIAFFAAVISTVIGTYAAFAIYKMSPFMRSATMKVLNIPMLNAEIVTGIALMLFFVFLSIPLGFTSLLLAHITFDVPYVALSVLPKLRQLNKSVYEAALDLGATPVHAFRKVILPDILPGIFTGALLAFTLSLDDFIISYFTSGPDYITLSVYINSMTKRAIPLTINALSTFMFVVVFVLLLVINFRKKKESTDDIY